MSSRNELAWARNVVLRPSVRPSVQPSVQPSVRTKKKSLLNSLFGKRKGSATFKQPSGTVVRPSVRPSVPQHDAELSARLRKINEEWQQKSELRDIQERHRNEDVQVEIDSVMDKIKTGNIVNLSEISSPTKSDIIHFWSNFFITLKLKRYPENIKRDMIEIIIKRVRKNGLQSIEPIIRAVEKARTSVDLKQMLNKFKDNDYYQVTRVSARPSAKAEGLITYTKGKKKRRNSKKKQKKN